jgi:hypothetical protein
MASGGIRQCLRDVTLYLVFLMSIITLGPLLFGFHLVCLPIPPFPFIANILCRPSSTPLKMS